MELEVEELKFDTHCIGLATRQASLMCYAFSRLYDFTTLPMSPIHLQASFSCCDTSNIGYINFQYLLAGATLYDFAIVQTIRHASYCPLWQLKFPSLPNPTAGEEYYYSSPSPHHQYQAAAMSFQAVLDSHPHPPPALMIW
jgi:hypothetical protein